MVEARAPEDWECAKSKLISSNECTVKRAVVDDLKKEPQELISVSPMIEGQTETLIYVDLKRGAEEVAVAAA